MREKNTNVTNLLQRIHLLSTAAVVDHLCHLLLDSRDSIVSQPITTVALEYP